MTPEEKEKEAEKLEGLLKKLDKSVLRMRNLCIYEWSGGLVQ